MNFKPITGVLPALITPLDKNENVRTEAAEQLIDFYVKEGADGLYMLGWTGEGASLPPEKRKIWAEAVLKANRGRLPIFVHVGYNTNLDDSVELARHAAEHGAFAVASVGISEKASLQDNIDYFCRISQAAPNIPFYIYWVEGGRTLAGGERLDPDELLEAMKAVPTFRGIKFTDNNFYILERFKKYNPDINILTGADSLAICTQLMGADGNIGALQAVTCRHYKKMMELFAEGKIKEARELQYRANEIAEVYSERGIGTLPGIKLILEQVYGIPAGWCTSPIPDVAKVEDPAAIERLVKVYKENIFTD